MKNLYEYFKDRKSSYSLLPIEQKILNTVRDLFVICDGTGSNCKDYKNSLDELVTKPQEADLWTYVMRQAMIDYSCNSLKNLIEAGRNCLKICEQCPSY